MSSTFHSVAIAALNLDEADRLRLAAELIDSVDGPADPAWDDAGLSEIKARRQRAFRSMVGITECLSNFLSGPEGVGE